MPRLNNVMKRVFGDMSRISVEDFLRIEEDLGIQETPSQAAWKKRYSNLAEEFIEDLDDLAIIENIIIQLRCKLLINSELRLSLSRNYIYARSLFFRKGKEINDIRVVVGRTEDHGTDLNALMNDQIFRDVCTSTLLGAMDREIDKNIIKLNKVHAG
jgi:hypothetical protein